MRCCLGSAADPELGNRGRKGRGWGLERGLCPLRRKILGNFKQNDAFLCKIFTIFEMHPVNRGRPPPSPAPRFSP